MPSRELVFLSNDPRRLSAAIGWSLAFFGAALLVVVAYAGWSANRNAVVRERQLVENALDQAVSRVLNEEKAIAWWDDAVLNAQARPLDLDWIDANIGLYFYETYGHDEIYLVDGQNRPIYGTVDGVVQEDPARAYANHADVLNEVVLGARGLRDPNLVERDAAFTSDQERYSYLLGARNAGWAGQILTVDGAPAVVSAMAIVPSVDETTLQGEPHLMVSVVRMDEEFMRSVGRTLLIEDLSLAPQPADQRGLTTQPFFTDDGAPAGYLVWTARQPGRTLLLFLLPLVVLGVGLAGLATLLMIRRLKRASSDLADREAQSRHQALHDALSGLPNRHHFVQELQAALDEVTLTRNNTVIAVAYIDVDRFKDINDTLGHHAGDTLITAVAKRLREQIGPEDFLSRFGGDEFAVMRRARGAESVDDLCRRLRRAFEGSFDIHGQDVRMSASIGVALAPAHGLSPQELMRHADIALYRAKGEGRDRVMTFSTEMAADVERRREIELDLQAALSAGELHLHYQPLIGCADGRLRGVEALLRWRHPTKGDISPGVFVPIAEEAGLMPALGAFVLARAFEQGKQWPELQLAINLSPVQFRHMDLVHLLERLLVEHDVDPSRVVLEVTEGVLMESTERNRAILDAIRELGFKIALDDFGTGYSSLRYLSDFRFDKIKIDRAFVTSVHERKRALTIIQSVVTLGRGLNMDIVAEGVETEAEASVMRLVGVNEIQGFYFSRPVPAERIAELQAAFNGSGDAEAGGDWTLARPSRRDSARIA